MERVLVQIIQIKCFSHNIEPIQFKCTANMGRRALTRGDDAAAADDLHLQTQVRSAVPQYDIVRRV